jgi:hypothetical protein
MLRHNWLLNSLQLLWHCEVVEGDTSLGLDLGKGVNVEVMSCRGTIVQVADFWGRHSMIVGNHISVNIWVFFVYQIQLWALKILIE